MKVRITQDLRLTWQSPHLLCVLVRAACSIKPSERGLAQQEGEARERGQTPCTFRAIQTSRSSEATKASIKGGCADGCETSHEPQHCGEQEQRTRFESHSEPSQCRVSFRQPLVLGFMKDHPAEDRICGCGKWLNTRRLVGKHLGRNHKKKLPQEVSSTTIISVFISAHLLHLSCPTHTHLMLRLRGGSTRPRRRGATGKSYAPIPYGRHLCSISVISI